jgi:hypothetical protein
MTVYETRFRNSWEKICLSSHRFGLNSACCQHLEYDADSPGKEYGVWLKGFFYAGTLKTRRGQNGGGGSNSSIAGLDAIAQRVAIHRQQSCLLARIGSLTADLGISGSHVRHAELLIVLR